MNTVKQPPEIFSERRKQALQCRAAALRKQSFVWDYLANEISERLRDVSRNFRDVLVIGPLAGYGANMFASRDVKITGAMFNLQAAMHSNYIMIDNDRLPFAPESFDLVVCAGILDSMNDLPGMLIQIRRCIRPDGLFLGSIFGEGNLATLKSALMLANPDRASAHIHPQIDIKNAADLLSRAGFALPVADRDRLRVRYSCLSRLLADIREMGVGNALAGPRAYFGKVAYFRLLKAWKGISSSEGKVEEQFCFIHLSGWAPSDQQPKPAPRGSATVSLANVLKSG